MYDGLTPLFDQVSNGDLTTFFKSEGFGVGPDGPATEETVPRPGVKIARDRFNVPHVTAETYDGGIWAAGWIAAEDRGLLLQQTRFNARVAAIDVPDLNAIDLISSLQNFQPSAADRGRAGQADRGPAAAGPEGEAVLHDIDTFISGINDYLAAQQPEDAAVDAQRRLLAQRDQGPVPRPGRRRRGAAHAVPLAASASASARRRA